MVVILVYLQLFEFLPFGVVSAHIFTKSHPSDNITIFAFTLNPPDSKSEKAFMCLFTYSFNRALPIEDFRMHSCLIRVAHNPRCLCKITVSDWALTWDVRPADSLTLCS